MRSYLLAILFAQGVTCAAPIDIDPSQINEIEYDGPFHFYFQPGSEKKLPGQLTTLLIEMEKRGMLAEAKLVNSATFTDLMSQAGSQTSYRLLGISESPKSDGLLSFFGLTSLPRFTVELFRRPSDFSPNASSLFKQTAAIHTLLLMVGQYLSDKLNALSPAVLAAYFYEYFGNFESILKMKATGRVLVLREDQLSLEGSPYYIAFTNLAEEIAINGAIAGTVPQPEGFPLTDVLAASASFGLAKVSIDKHVADLEIAKEAAEREGDEDRVRSLGNQQKAIQMLFFNGVVPALRGALLATKNSALEPACETIVNGAMGLIGCHAIYKEYRRVKGLTKIPQRFRGEGCAQALLLSR